MNENTKIYSEHEMPTSSTRSIVYGRRVRKTKNGDLEKMNWKMFLEDLEKNPRNYAQAIIKNLVPPKYVVSAIEKYVHLCCLCYAPQDDICVNCERSICAEHSIVLVGEKTKLEWWFCKPCVEKLGSEEMEKKVSVEDERFWLEDQVDSK